MIVHRITDTSWIICSRHCCACNIQYKPTAARVTSLNSVVCGELSVGGCFRKEQTPEKSRNLQSSLPGPTTSFIYHGRPASTSRTAQHCMHYRAGRDILRMIHNDIASPSNDVTNCSVYYALFATICKPVQCSSPSHVCTPHRVTSSRILPATHRHSYATTRQHSAASPCITRLTLRRRSLRHCVTRPYRAWHTWADDSNCS